MKKVSIYLLTNVILLLAGIILIVFHGVPNILIWGSRVLGFTFMLPAVVYLVMVALRHVESRSSLDYMGVLPAVGGLCFGLVMILKAHLFDGILQLLLGVLLLVLGLFHVIYLLLSRKRLNIKPWFHAAPLLVIVCGTLSLALPVLRSSVSTVVLITGICLLLFNFTSLQEYLAERRERRAVDRPGETVPVPEDDSISLVEVSSQESTL